MLTIYGNITAPFDWFVDETNASENRVYFVLGGETIYEDAVSTIKLKQHHVYLFPTNKPYKMRTNKSVPLQCLFMHLTNLPFPVDDVVALNFKENAFLAGLFELLLEAITHSQTLIIEALSDVFTGYLITHKKFNSYSDDIQKVIDYISQNYMYKININHLSDLCGYSTEYFIRHFSHNVGLTPYQYLTKYRMSLATKHIAEGKKSFEIAQLLGYKDSKVFGQTFKKTYGVSPREYKLKYSYLP